MLHPVSVQAVAIKVSTTLYVAEEKLPKYAAHGRWYLSQVAVLDNANNGERQGGIWLDDPDEVQAAASILPLYFINGEDSGPAVQVTVTPVSVPADNGGVEATPWAGELLLPLISD